VNCSQKKKAKRRRKRPRKLVRDNITVLANEIIKAQLKDASDIVFQQRPFADLRPRAETRFSRKIDGALLLNPVLPGYSSELKECYEQCWSRRKKRKLSNIDGTGEIQDELLNSMSVELPGGGMSGEESLSIALSSMNVNKDSPGPLGAQSSLSISSENDLLNDLENSMGDISSLLGPDRSISSAVQTPLQQRASKSFFLADDNGESIELEDQRVDMNAGWSTRTQKMVEYLVKKEGTDFVFQEMVKDKNPRMVAGFFYELLVLKTHDLITLSQDGSFGNISFSKGTKMIE